MIHTDRRDALDRANEARLVYGLVEQQQSQYEAEGHDSLEAFIMAEAFVAGRRNLTTRAVDDLVHEHLTRKDRAA